MRRPTGILVRLFAVCTVTLVFLLLADSTALAQKYKLDPISEEFKDKRKLKAAEQTKINVARGKKPFSGNRDAIDNYYRGYFFPAMTDPARRGQLADMRITLTKELALSTGEAHEFLLNLAYEQCRAHLSRKYDPAVRYNCALLLGDLNEREANLATATPPEPYDPATMDLAKLFASKNSDDGTKVACLIGLRRHAQLRGPKDAPKSLYDSTKLQNGLIALLGKFVNEATPPAGRNAAAHQWMRQIAVETLGYLRSPGKSNAVVQLLNKVATQAESPISLRCSAAEALARLDLEGSGITGDQITDTVGQVVFATCNSEFAEMMEVLKQSRSGREGGSFVTRSNPRTNNMDQDEGNRRKPKEFVAEAPETIPHRRRLIHQLQVLRRALQGDKSAGIAGIKTLDGAAEKSQQMVVHIDEIVAAAEDGDGDMRGLARSIRSTKEDLRAFISKEPPAPIVTDA